jgi:hypothetical protein
VQLKLKFQDRAKAFRSDRATVTFAQSYLKGMALEWFEPDLLLLDDPALRPLWMNNFKEFVLELQTNVGPHDPVGDAEHDLDHLSMKDGQRITKYVVEFNRIASQIRGYGEGALRHHFYNCLPDCIKDEISRVGKPSTLSDLRQLVQAIDVRYWERKSELSRQTKPSANPSTSRYTSNKPTMSVSASASSSAAAPKDSKESKGKAANSSGSSGTKPDLTTKLGKDSKLTTAECKHRFNNKLCMFCGLTGHIAKDCPKSTSRASKGRTIVTTPDDQPEVSSETKN